MKVLLATALLMVVPCGATNAEEPTDSVSVCELESRQDELLGRELLVRGYIYNDAHGMYASGNNCPEAYVWVVLDNPDVSKELLSISVRDIVDHYEEVKFRARLAFNDYRLPLTSHVSPRISLEFISSKVEAE
ncbi:hypothetical protein [Citromicrobium bathyomarinum]|uniref:hypothetical protein n=1 Tax=Citromicrobium bathyomarinum TaxID=72174 RepID=UPI003159FB5A